MQASGLSGLISVMCSTGSWDSSSNPTGLQSGLRSFQADLNEACYGQLWLSAKATVVLLFERYRARACICISRICIPEFKTKSHDYHNLCSWTLRTTHNRTTAWEPLADSCELAFLLAHMEAKAWPIFLIVTKPVMDSRESCWHACCHPLKAPQAVLHPRYLELPPLLPQDSVLAASPC